MPGKKAPKVAYAVFVGRNPGVYSSWNEAEKEVKGSPCARYRGYTVTDGGRPKAERDFQDFSGRTPLRNEGLTGHAQIKEEEIESSNNLEEPIRIHVSGRMAQPSTTPYPCFAQQLPTPISTIVEKRKERPLSWQLDEESRKKRDGECNQGVVAGAKGLESKRTVISPISGKALSASMSFYLANERAIEENIQASETVPSPNCSGIISDDTRPDDLQSSDHYFESTSCNENSLFDDFVENGDCNSHILVAPEGEDNSSSTFLFSAHNSEGDLTGKVVYPKLPLHQNAGGVDPYEVAPSEPIVTGNSQNITLDSFDPSIDFISLATSSDYGDFPDEMTMVDSISANHQRTEPRLCDEQLALVKLIMDGKNVFFTGSAGCGKSTVLKHVVNLFRERRKRVDIIAPTGRAALEINGRTLHNYAGWIPSSLSQPLASLESKARGTKVRKRLKATDVLIIDEISMVANHVFERLNHIMKSARYSDKPFGGVQVIVTGDFCQLPPVKAFEYCLKCGSTLDFVSRKDGYNCVKAGCLAHYEESEKWAFRSAAWQECNFDHISLKVIHRQKDAGLRALLEKRRVGLPYSHDEKWLLLEHPSDTRDAVKLFPRREEVKAINDMEFARLPGRALRYLCVDDFDRNSNHVDLVQKGDRCPKPMDHALEALEEHSLEPKLVLKEGMLVMLVVNWDLDSSLANGSQGTIVGFEKHNPNIFREVPPKWHRSSHKNRLVKIFVERTAEQEWPIVRFLNGRKRTIYPTCMINELGDDEPYSLLSRTQIPLIAAWAMTVHKAQGMTLSRMIVDLRQSFEPGQEYVALSRAETLGGLTVAGLPWKDPGTNEEVIEFLKEKNLMPAFNWSETNEANSEQMRRILDKIYDDYQMGDLYDEWS